jgi:hypothetical protein
LVLHGEWQLNVILFTEAILFITLGMVKLIQMMLDAVWEIIVNDLPELKQVIEGLLIEEF